MLENEMIGKNGFDDEDGELDGMDSVQKDNANKDDSKSKDQKAKDAAAVAKK